MFPYWEHNSETRMRVIAWKRLREFGERYPDAMAPLTAWYRVMEKSDFVTPHALKQAFPKVSILKGGYGLQYRRQYVSPRNPYRVSHQGRVHQVDRHARGIRRTRLRLTLSTRC